jgi:stalled ribosome rescue protein Dom34
LLSDALKHVAAADEASAIEELLLTNELFRVNDVALRKVITMRIEWSSFDGPLLSLI